MEINFFFICIDFRRDGPVLKCQEGPFVAGITVQSVNSKASVGVSGCQKIQLCRRMFCENVQGVPLLRGGRQILNFSLDDQFFIGLIAVLDIEFCEQGLCSVSYVGSIERYILQRSDVLCKFFLCGLVWVCFGVLTLTKDGCFRLIVRTC